MRNSHFGFVIAGVCAGAVNGLFGAAGGMVLIPLLTLLTDLEGQELFSASICIILPICLVSLGVTWLRQGLDFATALPYLIGGGVGGYLAGTFGQKIHPKWLHRALGILILWGGIRYLW